MKLEQLMKRSLSGVLMPFMGIDGKVPLTPENVEVGRAAAQSKIDMGSEHVNDVFKHLAAQYLQKANVSQHHAQTSLDYAQFLIEHFPRDALQELRRGSVGDKSLAHLIENFDSLEYDSLREDLSSRKKNMNIAYANDESKVLMCMARIKDKGRAVNKIARRALLAKLLGDDPKRNCEIKDWFGLKVVADSVDTAYEISDYVQSTCKDWKNEDGSGGYIVHPDEVDDHYKDTSRRDHVIQIRLYPEAHPTSTVELAITDIVGLLHDEEGDAKHREYAVEQKKLLHLLSAKLRNEYHSAVQGGLAVLEGVRGRHMLVNAYR